MRKPVTITLDETTIQSLEEQLSKERIHITKSAFIERATIDALNKKKPNRWGSL